MKIVKWIRFEDVTEDMECASSEGYYDVLEEEIIKNKYAFTGEFVQESGECCIPVFDDGKCIDTSWRTWGAIMAHAHNKIVGEEKYKYMDFYMDCCMDKTDIPLHYPEGE